MKFFDADKHCTYSPRRPRSEWKALSSASSNGFDSSQLEPIVRDYKICKDCGGSGLKKSMVKPGRTQYKKCDCKG